MSKTREISVWVNYKNLDFLEKEEGYQIIASNIENKRCETMVRAKLIVVVPEKSVTVTESEFDSVYISAWNERALNVARAIGLKDVIKEKLFGKE